MKKLLFSLVLVLSAPLAYACSCLFIETFCESVRDQEGNLWPGYSIYQVKVAQSTNAGMTVAVLKTFAGTEATHHDLFFVNGIEVDCKRRTIDFEVGKEYIISAWLVDEVWAIPFCGVSFLEIEDGKVKGPIAPGISEIAVDEFASIDDCGNLAGPNGENPLDNDPLNIAIYPTVSARSVMLEVINDQASVNIGIDVFDTLGRLMWQDRRQNVLSELIPIDMDLWASGLYFIRVKAAGKQKTFKIVKAL